MNHKICVLTYNIHKGYCTGNRRFVLESMRDRIAESGADVVFLQEIHGTAIKSAAKRRRFTYPDQPHFEYVADQSWPHYAYGRNSIYRKGDHGNAILSMHPFASWENIDISMFKRSSRSILHGVIEIPGRSIRLHTLCVHLGLLEQERRDQFQALTDRINEHVPQDEPMIIAGDFNDWRQRAERQPPRNDGLGEVPPPPMVKKQRIVKPATLVRTTYLETSAEVNDFLDALRTELEQAIANHERVRIR